MFAWKYLLQICQKDSIACSVYSLEETCSLIWFPAFISLKGTNDNYCLLWSVIFSMNNSPKETSASQMSCDSRQYASIFHSHTWVARAGTGTDCPAPQCGPKSVSWLWGYFVAFPGVLKSGWPGYTTFVPQEGTCMCQLTNICGLSGRYLAPKWHVRMSRDPGHRSFHAFYL